MHREAKQLAQDHTAPKFEPRLVGSRARPLKHGVRLPGDFNSWMESVALPHTFHVALGRWLNSRAAFPEHICM